MKRLLSVLLVALLVISSGTAVFAADYTEQYLGEGFTRLNLTNTAFSANTARTFSVNIQETSEYTVFIGRAKDINTKNNFEVTFTKGGTTLTLLDGASDKQTTGYGYAYSRIGATEKTPSSSVALEKGTWTLSVKSLVDVNLNYIDIRMTVIPIDGTNQAIYPSDYNAMTVAGGANYINNEINTGYARVEGYDYWADYINSNLNPQFTSARGIHYRGVNGGKLTYKVDVKSPGTYKIGVTGQYYRKDTSKAATDSFTMTVDSVTSLSKAVSFAAGDAAKQALKTEYFTVDLTEGVHSIVFTMQRQTCNNYIQGLTFKKVNATPDGTEFCLVSDAVDQYVRAAQAAYATEEYADYTTTLASSYSLTHMPKSVKLEWVEIEEAASYTLYISENNAFPENDTLKFESIANTEYSIYNLYPGRTYYWYVKGNNGEVSQTKYFTTKAGTIRQIYAEGGLNIRDIGGWNGLNDGMAYRGAEIDGAVPGYPRLTEAGFDTLRNDLKIRTDLDLRIREQAGEESVLGSHINQVVAPVSGYTSAFSGGSITNYAVIMKTFSDIDNYPIYFHCSGGADRTGTVAMLVEAIAGANEADLSIDFEMTTGSGRARYRYNHLSYYYADTIAQLKTYPGNTLQEKAENYAMTTLGLKRAEVSNIQSILGGNKVVFKYITDLRMGRNLSVQLKNYNGQKLSSVTINGKPVTGASLSNEGVLSVNFSETGIGAINFEDGTTLKCNVVEPGVCDVITLDNGFKRIVLDEQDSVLTKDEAREFSFSVETAGDYALFLRKTNEANGFKATISNGTSTYTISDDSAKSDAYGYNYVRLDASDKSDSLYLTSGNWTLSLTPLQETTLHYIDLRLVSVAVSGMSMAIYPSDYYEYESISDGFSVNGQMQSEIAKQEGYPYNASYENKLLAETFAYARPIRIEKDKTVSYKFDASIAGNYKVRIDHGFYSEETPATAKSGVLTVALGNETVNSFKADITQSGVSARNTEEFEIELATGENILSLTQTGTEGDIYGITLVKAVDVTPSKCVMVDNNLTRIEIDSNHLAVSAGEIKCYEFTVKADGDYTFFANVGKVALNASVIVEDVKTGEFISYYDGELPFNSYENYRKLAIGSTEPISLKAGKDYKLYFSPSAAVTAMTFIDVINVNLEISGKTIIPAHYFKTSNVDDRTINSVDRANQAGVDSGYTVAGDYTSSDLATQNKFSDTNYISPYMINNSSYTYVLDVKKPGYYKIGSKTAYYNNTSTVLAKGSEHYFGITVDETKYSLKYVNTQDVPKGYSPQQLIETPSVYLTEGKHTITIDNKGGARRYYLLFVYATPQDEAVVTLDATNKKATVSYGFNEGVTGKVVVALYSGMELVGIKDYDAEKTFGGKVEISYTKTPDRVKVMAWKDLINVMPLRGFIEAAISGT